MSIILYNDMSVSEMDEFLREHKVKTSKSPYDSNEHFDFNTSGKNIKYLGNSNALTGKLLGAVNASSNILGNLNFAELVNPVFTLMEKASAEDFTVRVYGSINTEKNILNWKWQIADAIADIKKLWDKKCVSDIFAVQSQTNLSVETAEIFGAFRVTETTQDQIGCTVKLDSSVTAVLDSMTGTPNVSEWKKCPDGSIMLRFCGKFCSMNFENGTIVTLVLKESRTGMKGEKPILHIGGFDGKNYYLKQA